MATNLEFLYYTVPLLVILISILLTYLLFQKKCCPRRCARIVARLFFPCVPVSVLYFWCSGRNWWDELEEVDNTSSVEKDSKNKARIYVGGVPVVSRCCCLN